jgi:hypothetical protein
MIEPASQLACVETWDRHQAVVNEDCAEPSSCKARTWIDTSGIRAELAPFTSP